MNCYWVNDPEIGRYDVPGCMGAAVYGPKGCTCGIRRGRKTLEKTIDKLVDRIDNLEKRLADTGQYF